MQEFYWGCLIFGVIFSIATVLFADIAGSFLDSFFPALSLDHLAWLQPIVIVGGMTLLGGTGVLLTNHTELTAAEISVLSLLTATVLSALIYFLYVKPMRTCENSSGFFIKQLIGKTGEVVVPIPASGCGEVLIKIGAGNTNQIAVSNDNVALAAGTQVVVTDVKNKILYVSNYQEQHGGGAE